MNTTEAKKRIREIEKQRQELDNERDKLRKLVEEERENNIREKRSEIIGKCFKIGLFERCEKYEGLRAFKIVRYEDGKDINRVRCVCLFDDGAAMYGKRGIFNQVLYLWSADRPSMMDVGRKTIEKFDIISGEEFATMLQEYKDTIESHFEYKE